MRKSGWISLIGLLLLTLPAWGQEVVAAEASAPAPDLKSTLKRLVVGNQGAILKVWRADGVTEPEYYRGLDDRDTAPYSTEDQVALADSLGMSQVEMERAAIEIITNYDQLPKKNALAFLGLVNSLDNESPYAPSANVEAKIKDFLLTRMKEDKSVIMRRQACLSLAVGAATDEKTIEGVLEFYTNSENLWETFPVQQFFEYHSERIRTMPSFPQIRDRAGAVNSLYTNNILGYLNGQ